MNKPTQPGPTGNFPKGKRSCDDGGELTVGISVDPETHCIVLNFGTKTDWIGMYPEQAMTLAMLLVKHARPYLPDFDELMEKMNLDAKK